MKSSDVKQIIGALMLIASACEPKEITSLMEALCAAVFWTAAVIEKHKENK